MCGIFSRLDIISIIWLLMRTKPGRLIRKIIHQKSRATLKIWKLESKFVFYYGRFVLKKAIESNTASLFCTWSHIFLKIRIKHIVLDFISLPQFYRQNHLHADVRTDLTAGRFDPVHVVRVCILRDKPPPRCSWPLSDFLSVPKKAARLLCHMLSPLCSKTAPEPPTNLIAAPSETGTFQ